MKSMKKIISIIIISLSFIACTQNGFKNPENVQAVLDKAGKNKSELQKVIKTYQNPEDSLKLKATWFLLGNMDEQGYSYYEVADSNDMEIGFNALDYPTYKAMTHSWDSIVQFRGKLHQKKVSFTKDYEIIKAAYLINHIELAFQVWEENPWSKHLNFDQICEYILPYRSTNEPLEDWRTYFIEKYSWLKDSMKNINDPVEACVWINDEIKSWFRFDPRFYEHATDLGLREMVEGKMGRCEDMTNLAIYAMRANGIPVMSDFTPYWAKTGNNHAWNAIMDNTGKVVIFMGGESNPGIYRLNQAKAKVYRKTFAKQPFSLAEIKEEWEKAPPYINRNSIVDVTSEYIPVDDVEMNLVKEVPDSTNFAYICVFNTGEWKAIHWGRIEADRKVKFTCMGMDIAYLPAYYVHENIFPAGQQFILTEEGEIKSNHPDMEDRIVLKLSSTTRRTTKNSTDNIKKVFLTDGESYELFYWDYKWISLGVQKAEGKPLIFKDVPSGAMYWLINTTPTKDRPERIFTVDTKGEQVWW
jgi:hypothetical protein